MEIKKMTKKFLLAAFSIALVGSVFTSCKDNTEDIMAEMNSQNANIQEQIDRINQQISSSPQTIEIGVKEDNGVYYWTVNGEWLTDENGNKIKAEGLDGAQGIDDFLGVGGAQVCFFSVTHDVEVVFLGLEAVFCFFEPVLQAELHVANRAVYHVRDVLVFFFPGIMDRGELAVFPDKLEQALETVVVVVVYLGA